jgi:hypothetical protein
MTAAEIATRLTVAGKSITPQRVRKLKALCARSKVDLGAVLAVLPTADASIVAAGGLSYLTNADPGDEG